MAASMADLAAAMDDALLVSVSFHQRRRRRMEGEGRGLQCEKSLSDLCVLPRCEAGSGGG